MFLLVVAVAGLVSVGCYLGWAALATPAGFPVDDAWIHQVFARNLAQHGEFAYNLGQPVAGSTSPLWTILLVPGYLFGGEGYKWWAYFLGLLFLLLTALQVARLYRLLFSPFPPTNAEEVEGLSRKLLSNSKSGLGKRVERTQIASTTSDIPLKWVVKSAKASAWPAYLIAALFVVFEWRLVWAGASGMETLLFTFGTLWLIHAYLETARQEDQTGQPLSANFRVAYGIIGLLGGLLTLVRPEGMVLLGLIGLDTGRRALQWNKPISAKSRWLVERWLAMILFWAVPLVPYLIFNYSASGSPLPTTFYAKASGYGGDHSPGALLEYFGNALFELIGRGPELYLLPGFVYALYLCLKRGKREGDWRPLIWPPLLLTLYAIQLPVTYHHGRYLMPLIPFLIIYGVFGTVRLIEQLRRRKLYLVARLLPMVLALPVLVSWFNGAQAYQFDVKLINDEQVRIGIWLRDNTPPQSSVATHDIGAIGYFSGRKLVDTAGLISSQYIKIVQNQPAILAQLQTEGVDYLALFPDWYFYLYPLLSDQGRKVFQPAETYLAPLGKENMAVFRLK